MADASNGEMSSISATSIASCLARLRIWRKMVRQIRPKPLMTIRMTVPVD
jgi:hypothetical protein